MTPLNSSPTVRVRPEILVVSFGGALGFVAASPLVTLVAAAWAVTVAVVSDVLESRLARRARDRSGEDIGTFARSFDRRSTVFDPWVIRAVWDALAPWTKVGDLRLALRPSDVIADLGCVDEDLDDVLIEAASRARRDLTAVATHAPTVPVETVGDLVAFVVTLPRSAAA